MVRLGCLTLELSPSVFKVKASLYGKQPYRKIWKYHNVYDFWKYLEKEMMLGSSIDRDAALQLWESSGPSGYMIVEANGGLNQQHCDMQCSGGSWNFECKVRSYCLINPKLLLGSCSSDADKSQMQGKTLFQ